MSSTSSFYTSSGTSQTLERSVADAADDAQVLFAEGDLVETACGEEGEDEYWMPAQIIELLYDEENKIVVDG